MIFSIGATILVLITMLKFISKRSKNAKFDAVMAKIHCKCGWMVLILLLMHFLQAVSLLESRPLYIYILGIIALMCIMTIVGSFYFRKQLGKKWIVIHRGMSCIVIIIILGHIGSYLYGVMNYQKEVRSIKISEVDLSKIPDGVYDGEYDVEYIYAKVEVTVKQGVITNVDILEHRNERGSTAERITDNIVKEQKIEVDAITGATNSSKVIKKAVEDALKGLKR